MWLHHPSGKIAVYVKDPVDVVVNASEVSQDEPKKRSKKK